MKITDTLNGKRVLLWGYGLEGKSTEKFIRKYCKDCQVSVFQGRREDIDEDAYDYIIKSPGIVAWDLSSKFTSMTELFLSEFSGQVIGVTGTKGKSTTSSLMYTVLSRCTDRPTLLMGNIGLPALDYYGEITDDTIIVFDIADITLIKYIKRSICKDCKFHTFFWNPVSKLFTNEKQRIQELKDLGCNISTFDRDDAIKYEITYKDQFIRKKDISYYWS